MASTPAVRRTGRPPHVPDDDQRTYVEGMTAFGMTAAQICSLMGLSENTLRKHYRRELDIGHLKANAKVASSLFETATKGSGREKVTAQIFWLKTRAGWKETTALEHSGAIDGGIQIHISPEEAKF